MNMYTRWFLCAISAVALVFAGGCESEKDDDSEISITPMTCKIKVHESRVFTASGGQNLRWSVQNPSLGTLSTTSGSTVTYMASSLSGDQILTVVGENAYGEEKSPANATIQQVNPEEESGNSSSVQEQSTEPTNVESSGSAQE